MNSVIPRPLRSEIDSRIVQSQSESGSSAPLLEPTLLEYWRIVKNHRWIILATFVLAVATAGVLTLLMTPIYTAETIVMIDPRPPQVMDIKQVISEPQRPENDLFATQFEMLRSRSLIRDVITREHLMAHPLYREDFNKPDGLGEVSEKAINVYADKMLDLTALKSSRLVKIEISTADPELSARLANSHAEAFVAQGLNITARASRDAIEFLSRKLEELKERVKTAETALNAFRRQQDIVSLGEKENITVDRLSDLNKRLTDAEVERIALEAQVMLIRKGAYDSVPAVVNNLLIQTLRAQQSKLEVESANLNTQYTEEFPSVIQINAQLAETRRRLDTEIRRVTYSIESAFRSAEAKETRLRQAMEQQKADTLGLKDAGVQYAVLAREADSNRLLYDSVLQRLKELGVAAELRASNIFVIDKAVPPLSSSKPNLMLYLGTSGLLGLLGGLAAAFFKEYLNNTLRTPHDVEQFLKLPNLAVVPEFRSIMPPKDHAQGRELVKQGRAQSPIAEAYGMLHTSIRFSCPGEFPKSILFTSGVPGEGKTVTAVNTAITCARMGSRVILIDADLRAPKCHEAMRAHRSPGLTELVTGQAELKTVIQNSRVARLDLIASGSTPPTPPALLGSERMKEIILALHSAYDFVIIDSPPVMPVTDAVVLSTIVEGVIVVVNSRQTPSHVVKEAYTRLHYANARMLGVVLNRADVESNQYAYYPATYSEEGKPRFTM